MQRPRVRFRLRALLIAVALVALALGVGMMYRRWAYCRDRAAWYRAQVQVRLDDAARSAPDTEWIRGRFSTDLAHLDDESRANLIASLDRRTEWYRELARQCDALARRFERAAWRPWAAVPREDGSRRD